MAGSRLDDVVARMEVYADRTGLTSSRPPCRYLWTDAFAVCNYIGLARATGNAEYVDLARRLVDQVHRVLGRYRDGQYFHYLAKWMLALDQLARLTGRQDYNRWARELAATAKVLTPTDDLSGLGELAGHYQGMLSHSELATADPLGLGGLMADAYRLHQMEREGAVMPELRDCLLEAAVVV